MEINRSDTEKTQQIVWSTSDGQEVGQVRSYQCSFCKRGFSNAQALGGHMNIHRKDRARLKGSYDETLVSTDIAKKNLSSSPPASPDDDMLQPESSDHKRPWIFSEKDESESPRKNCSKEVVQLPLFAEKSSTSTHFGTSSCADGHVEKSVQSDQSSSSLELDLELRLGPEPHD